MFSFVPHFVTSTISNVKIFPPFDIDIKTHNFVTDRDLYVCS